MSVLQFSADPALVGAPRGFSDDTSFGAGGPEFGGLGNVIKNSLNINSKSKDKVLQYYKIFKNKETACLMPYDNSHGKEKYSVIGDLLESLVEDARGKNKETMFRKSILGGFGMREMRDWNSVTIQNILDYKEWAYSGKAAGAKDTSKLCFEWGISSKVLNELTSLARQAKILQKGGDLRNMFFKLHLEAFVDFATKANSAMGTKQSMANTTYSLEKYFKLARACNEKLMNEIKENERMHKLAAAEKDEEDSIDAKHFAEARANSAAEKKQKFMRNEEKPEDGEAEGEVSEDEQ